MTPADRNLIRAGSANGMAQRRGGKTMSNTPQIDGWPWGVERPQPQNYPTSHPGHSWWRVVDIHGATVAFSVGRYEAAIFTQAPAMLALLRELSVEPVGRVHPLRPWIDRANTILRAMDGK